MKSTQMFLILGWLALSWVCTSCSKGDEPAKIVPEPVVAESITLVSGDGQSGMVATTLANPVAVMVKDKKGKAFAGTTVNFATTEGSVSPATATTDTEGMATVSWTLGASAGTQKVTAIAFKTNGTTPLSGSPLAATATASTEPLVAESMAIVAGDGQTAVVETVLANPIKILVKDQNGDALGGVAVNFAVTEGAVSAATATTDAEGKATVTWTLGESVGTQTITVTAFKADGTTALEGSPLAVTARGIEEPLEATSMALVSGDGQTALVKTTLTIPIEVVVKDQNDLAFAGATVDFEVSEGSVSSKTATTDVEGKAAVSWTLGTSVGTQTVTVTAFKADGTTPLTGSPLAVTAIASANIQVSTLAGSIVGFADGSGADAQFDGPVGVAVDVAGNVYIAEFGNHKIRKITPGGMVSTLAGSTSGFADGNGADAQFNNPIGVAVDVQGNIYVTDYGNQKIRKISPGGMVSTLAGSTSGFADGTGADAQFFNPYGIAVDIQGYIYVGDSGNHKIRKITPGGMVSTLAGSTQGFADGSGADARFDFPVGVAVDLQGYIYVADYENNKIRKITQGGMVSTLAGSTLGFADGSGADAKFEFPTGVAVDVQGNIYVCDTGNHKIRKITPGGTVSTLAGSTEGFADGSGPDAQFNNPFEVAVDIEGNVYVADLSNHKIRKITQ